MIDAKTGSIPYGVQPWHQTSWDARAAGNFVFGGAGSGLIAFTVAAGTAGPARAALLVAGLVLVALGLLCVSLELGRPLRALNVLVNPRASWMSREAIAAALLMIAGAIAVLLASGAAWIAAVLALAFMYCQANILRAARGIPAWREPMIVPLVVATALTEGGGIYVAVSALAQSPPLWPLAGFVALVALRLLVWLAYRRRLGGRLAPGASSALRRTGAWLQYGGTLAPLAIVALVAASPSDATPLLIATAGVLAVLSGSHLKYTLITRAAFNQGFALVHLPVRGVQR